MTKVTKFGQVIFCWLIFLAGFFTDKVNEFYTDKGLSTGLGGNYQV